ncbi:MAG: hypothetical protein KJ711_04695 [Candidatus Omnitrophica bacterium]|nr:hypothetical protein [Candidatus Omnitrophota bacterium]
MAKYETKLKIADVIIKMQSKFPLSRLSKSEEKSQVSERFDNFFYEGSQKSDILIDVNIVDELPQSAGARDIFITTHFQDGSENWRLLKKGNTYIYKSPLEDKKQLMLVNITFDKVTAYLLSKKGKDKTWQATELIYDFLQVLLINYFARNNEGIFTHSIGVKDSDGKGLLFTGKSESGKSTTARLWHKHSKAMVLNDDRIIVRKIKNKFFIYGCPWHGEFSDYLTSRIESAPIDKIFFIHHAPKNAARQVKSSEAFNLLYPALFPTFWDKKCLENISLFCLDLIKSAACYSLGFVNNKRIIEFVRKINANIR